MYRFAALPLSCALSLSTLVTGCGSDETEEAGAPAKPTYNEHVGAILNQHCASCHAAGQIGPFALDSYDAAKPLAASIQASTAARRMPPFHVDGSGECNTYQDARLLTEAEIETLARWADQGAPEGDPGTKPPAPAAPPALGAVSLTLDPGVAYLPDPSLDDDYRCFVVDPGLTSDTFLTGYEVHPGEPSEVHHVVVFSTDTPAEAQAARDLDAADETAGYRCFGGAETGGGRSLVAWAPGTGATLYPQGTGLRLIAGQPVVVQVHYNQGTLPDRTTVDLQLEDSVPYEALITAAFNLNLDLSPDQASVTSSATTLLPASGLPFRIHGVYPHMHNYGRSMRVDMQWGAQSACLVDAPDYAFGWQQFYFYEEPLEFAPGLGGTLDISCTFDTRGAPGTVRWGEGTGDEMCIAAFYVTL